MKLRHYLGFSLALALLALPAVIARPVATPPVLSPEAQLAESREFFFSLLTSKIDDYWHRGDYDDAVRLLEAQIELDPRWIEAYASASWLRWSQKRFSEAEAFCRQGIAANPKDYRLYFELGRMYFRTAKPGSLYQKNPAQARQLYQQASQQLALAVARGAPGEVARLLADAYDKLGRYAEARKVLEKILHEKPGDTLARAHLERLKKIGK